MSEKWLDRGKFWQAIADNRELWQKHAPENYDAAVIVYLTGRADPLVVGRVETSARGGEGPYVMLYTASESDYETPARDDRVVFALGEHIVAVEIIYVPAKAHPIGFSHRVISDPSNRR
jgi:hypothetical protein